MYCHLSGSNVILAHLFHKEDQKYGAITVARSALSTILPKIRRKTFGQDLNVSRMIKGIFKLRPSLPKYITTYDPNIMLRYIDSLPHDNFLLMKLLTKKVVHITAPAKWTTCAVLAGLKIIKIKPIKWHIPFYIDKILETTKPGKPQKPLEYREFNSNKKLCVILSLKEYISRTVLIREYLEGNKDQLILSYAYPHKPIICQSISRYIKLVLELSGIDATVFTAH